jgi:hypothetical protein
MNGVETEDFLPAYIKLLFIADSGAIINIKHA